MEETIYQTVWCQVFGLSWQWAATQEDQQASAETCNEFAAQAANIAAAGAVQKWDESKRLAAITVKNKGGK